MIKVYIGETYKKEHYQRMYSKGINYFFSKETWKKECDFSTYCKFINWLRKKYGNELINHRDFSFVNKEVLVITIDESLSEEEYFLIDGELAKAYHNGSLDEVFNNFLSEINQQTKKQ